MNKTDETRKRICEFYNAIYRVKNRTGPERRKGQGRIAKKMPPGKVRNLGRQFNHKHGKSQRKAARKFGIDPSYVNKLLKSMSIDCRRKQLIPDRSEQQAKDAKPKCKILTEKYKNREWILDDESYFTLSHSTISGNKFFYSSDVSLTPANVKYATKAKYEDKLLVWLAMSRKGISKLFITPSGLAINQHIYKEECINKRLIPFIEKYHSQDEIIFWPDLATSHYAESVCDFLIESKIDYVGKYENPANLPECRPIERFWAVLKSKVYEDEWKADNTKQLDQRIRYCCKNLEENFLTTLFDSMLKNLKAVAREGVIEKR